MRAPIRYRHVYEDVSRHGTVRVYFWRGRGHRKIRMTEPVGSAAFLAAYERLLAASEAGETIQPETPRHGTLRSLCVAYFGSPPYRRLAQRTQRVRRLVIEAACREPVKTVAPDGDRIGDIPIEHVTTRTIKALRDRCATSAPETGNARVKALRSVYAWALDDERPGVTVNPARDVAYIRTGSGGFHTWSPEEVRQFEARHPEGSPARLALTLMLLTGVRRSDAIRLGRQHVRETQDGPCLMFRPVKGGSRAMTLTLPILPELAAAIVRGPCGDLTYLVSGRGQPWASGDSFGNWFRDRCREAGLPQCSAHGLRKAGAVRAAEAGASTQQLMAIFGWQSLRHAERYTQAANRDRLAADGMRHLSHPGGAAVSHQKNSLVFARKKKAVVPRAGIEPATP
ncbi:MAG: tyrosine-type recombinase/integrase [Hyphomicrobiaceae bacterium]|nr:tyrosine-type recombinase/integrase [Hyphomicrobiaceae bacterium]